MVQTDRPGLVQVSVARAGLLWLWPHFWPSTTQVMPGEERFLSSHSLLEASNLNCLFKFFFHSALREIEFDPLLLKQVRLGGFVCLEKKH